MQPGEPRLHSDTKEKLPLNRPGYLSNYTIINQWGTVSTQPGNEHSLQAKETQNPLKGFRTIPAWFHVHIHARWATSGTGGGERRRSPALLRSNAAFIKTHERSGARGPAGCRGRRARLAPPAQEPGASTAASSDGCPCLPRTFGQRASRRQEPTLIAINIMTANEHLGRRVDDYNKAKCPRSRRNHLQKLVKTHLISEMMAEQTLSELF